jgi:hypothetical protein
MKRIVYLTCIGILALTLTSLGAQRNKGGGQGSARVEVRAARTSRHPEAVEVIRLRERIVLRGVAP